MAVKKDLILIKTVNPDNVPIKEGQLIICKDGRIFFDYTSKLRVEHTVKVGNVDSNEVTFNGSSSGFTSNTVAEALVELAESLQSIQLGKF